jgi:hypothetical protein
MHDSVSCSYGANVELDAGIARAVVILQKAGVATYESCEGGEGHAFSEPTVRFRGSYAEGIVALGVALQNGLPVYQLRRVWRMDDGELTGPWWDLVFVPTGPSRRGQRNAHT